MIVFWIILAIIALLVLFILFGTVQVRIVYREKLRVSVGLCGIRYPIVSDKEKKQKPLKDPAKCKHPEKLLEKELKRKQLADEKAARAAEKKRLKAKEKAELKKKKKALKEAGKTVVSPNVKEILEMILALLKRLYEVTRGNVKLNFRKMHIAVGTGDAAKTAITYGVIVQSASYLLTFIEEKFARLKRREGAMAIYPDYTASKTTVDIDIICSVKLRKLVSIAINMFVAFTEEKKLAHKKAVIRARKKAAKAASQSK